MCIRDSSTSGRLESREVSVTNDPVQRCLTDCSVFVFSTAGAKRVSLARSTLASFRYKNAR